MNAFGVKRREYERNTDTRCTILNLCIVLFIYVFIYLVPQMFTGHETLCAWGCNEKFTESWVFFFHVGMNEWTDLKLTRPKQRPHSLTRTYGAEWSMYSFHSSLITARSGSLLVCQPTSLLIFWETHPTTTNKHMSRPVTNSSDVAEIEVRARNSPCLGLYLSFIYLFLINLTRSGRFRVMFNMEKEPSSIGANFGFKSE